ncbi:MAG: ThuA domain-containing protein [Candidatus Omnitrophica bacterium]|nr:ThuA domain-containing protein [Candidatus Omnitrophota bacterium]
MNCTIRKQGRRLLLLAGAFFLASQFTAAGKEWAVYRGGDGPGAGKNIVFVTGDEEYRSEESMPQMAKILSVHHGFDCTVLFAINKEDGTIDPYQNDNIPGLHLLQSADLMVIFIRFRDLPPEQMQHIIDYIHSGKPIIGVRPSVAAFKFNRYQDQPYAKYDYTYKGDDFYGGFGRQVLGETWIKHYGKHQEESTRGLIAAGMENHPIVQGCRDIWGPSDVYGLTTLEGECTPLIMGQVLSGMNPDDPPNPEKNLTPVAWLKKHRGAPDRESYVFTTTMGHGDDFHSEGFRRLLVNACYWLLGVENITPAASKVDIVGAYNPNPIGFHRHKTGLKPVDHQWPEPPPKQD